MGLCKYAASKLGVVAGPPGAFLMVLPGAPAATPFGVAVPGRLGAVAGPGVGAGAAIGLGCTVAGGLFAATVGLAGVRAGVVATAGVLTGAIAGSAVGA